MKKRDYPENLLTAADINSYAETPIDYRNLNVFQEMGLEQMIERLSDTDKLVINAAFFQKDTEPVLLEVLGTDEAGLKDLIPPVLERFHEKWAVRLITEGVVKYKAEVARRGKEIVRRVEETELLNTAYLSHKPIFDLKLPFTVEDRLLKMNISVTMAFLSKVIAEYDWAAQYQFNEYEVQDIEAAFDKIGLDIRNL